MVKHVQAGSARCRDAIEHITASVAATKPVRLSMLIVEIISLSCVPSSIVPSKWSLLPVSVVQICKAK